MQNTIKECAELCSKGKRIILVTPLRRIPELRSMLLEAGMTSVTLAGHVLPEQRVKIIAEANLIITPPSCISTGVSLKGFDALFYCWKEEMQGQYLDDLKARWEETVMSHQIQRDYAVNQ